MPKTPIDYTKSCVYRLIYNDVTYYVGSTTNMRQRKSKHKYNTNIDKSDKYDKSLYEFIRNNGGWEKWDMILVQEYPDCKSSDELRMYERQHYDFYKPSLNLILPHISKDEIIIRDKINSLIYRKKYRESNPEKMKLYRDENREKNNAKETCSCGGKFCHIGYTRHIKTQKHIRFMEITRIGD
jgi:GIY-YIG catalytic domain